MTLEALFIKDIKPSINTKDELRRLNNKNLNWFFDTSEISWDHRCCFKFFIEFFSVGVSFGFTVDSVCMWI